ncbi:Ppx/GppA phosphatase family protein [Gynurincola endophyticus]|uniref:Ppx/GppA phosphatase family protein n=1 Tax=Gynurincola endophyticus TaxID=2479004 RepID=UPI000F8EBEA8|nr:exopolyphosphatase [Gynurincola endophyticus]
MRLAAIDIGSNAARLLIVEVQEEMGMPQFQKLNLVRVPLRLGFDVFEKGEISEIRRSMILSTMKAYRNLLDAYQVEHVTAAATSAMRDAKNSPEIIEAIHREANIQIEIISGDTEATLIYENHIAEYMNNELGYLYIDVGGGSTELTYFAQGELKFQRSFNIGTIRLLKNQVEDSLWNEMESYVNRITKFYKTKGTIAIGSGGNINKIFSLSKRKEGKPLPRQLLNDYYKELSAVSMKDRIRLYKLREDRADVIVPALQIYTQVMKWADIEEIYVPKIGLADGLIQHLYAQIHSKA